MPSPIFHTVAAVTAAVCTRKPKSLYPWALCALLVLAANLPDFDLIPAIVFGSPPMRYHHGFTHSFGFCLAAGLLLSLIPLKHVRWGTRFFLLVGVAFSHLILDLLNANTSVGCLQLFDCGQPLAWPLLSRKWGTLYPIFGDLALTTGIASWFTPSNMLTLSAECGYALLFFLTFWLARQAYVKVRTIRP